LIPGLMEILLQIRPWRLLYILRGSWSYGNITRDKTMASFVHKPGMSHYISCLITE
jgi:hypothetical protein